MGITRRIIFPTIRLLLWAIIAIALVKLAFGGQGDEDSRSPAVPTAEVHDRHVVVGKGTVENTVTVTGTISIDPAVPVKATSEGKVNKILADPGESVEKGDRLLELVVEEQADPVTVTDEEGNVTEKQSKPKLRYRVVRAPATGVVGEYSVLAGQTVTIGDSVGSIETGTFSVSGSISPEQQYRLAAAPSGAKVAARGGPAPFDCTNLQIGRRATQSAEDPAPEFPEGPPGDMGGGSGTSISCSVPPDVKVFDGLTATMAISAGRSENVVVVPVTAVQGAFGNGKVWVVTEGSEPQEREVTLGLTDGEQVEVTKGLSEGDRILEFVPIPDAEPIEDHMLGDGRVFVG